MWVQGGDCQLHDGRLKTIVYWSRGYTPLGVWSKKSGRVWNVGSESLWNSLHQAGDPSKLQAPVIYGYLISPSLEDLLEKEMATLPSILAWEIPWTEEPGSLQSMRSQGVRHD